MDPQAALYDLIDALNDGDRELALELLEALATWISRHGFLPTTDRNDEINAFIVSRNNYASRH